MIVIATNNGMDFLPKLVESLGQDCLVIDTGSTDEKFKEYLKTLKNVAHIPGGYCIGAYEYAFKNYKDDWYFFMHDSMLVKDKNFLESFKNKGEVMAWIGFKMDFDAKQAEYLKKCFGDISDLPPKGIFGPIFYTTRYTMEILERKNLLPPHPNNIFEVAAMERGYAIAFHKAGFKINYLEEYDNDRIDIKRDYRLFDKFRPNRR